MSKKTADKRKAPAPVSDDPEPWITELKGFIINDENWSCNVSMLVEQNPHVLSYVSAFNSVFISKENIRPCIKVLSENSLAIDMIERNYNANIHKVSTGYKKLSEEALKYYSSDGFSNDIPISILASLVKYHIYNLRIQSLAENHVIKTYEKNIQKLNNDSRLGIENIMKSVATATNKEKKGTGNTTKSASSKKSGRDDVSKMTNLRKRGEEILDYIDIPSDAPSDGPNLYIILHSFLRENLPLELLKLGIPLLAIVKLHNFCNPDEKSLIDKMENIKICQGLDSVSKETTLKQRKFSNAMADFIIKQSIIESFWQNFLHILNNHENIMFFKDTIFMKFYPKHVKGYEQFSNGKPTEEAIKMIRKSIYTQICHLQYDIQDVKRQHQNLINNLVDRDVGGKSFYNFKQMNLYSSTVESVPPEVLNIPFILHCILIQVEYLVDHGMELTENESTTKNIEDENNKIEEEYNPLEEVLEELDEKHDLFIKEEVDKGETIILPTVLIHGNETGIKTHWCSNSDYVQTVTINILQCFWEQFLTRHLPVYDEVISLDELQETDLYTMLKQHGEVTVRDRLCNVPCTYHSIPVEDKVLSFCTHDADEENEVSEKSLRVNCRCNDFDPDKFKHFNDPSKSHYLGNIYDQHGYCFEEMTSDIMLQKLFHCLENYNCIDVLQDYFKGRHYMKFHHKKTCLEGEYLLGTLKTKIALRDFYDYTIEEEFYWLHNQELFYDKCKYKKEMRRLDTALRKLEYLKNKMDFLTSKVCEETNFVVQNSLKREGYKPLELPIIPSYTEDEPKYSDINFEYISDINLESFDIDVPYRVQFSEKQQEFIISERSTLCVKKLMRLYKDEAVMIQTTINDHSLYLYQPLTSKICSDVHLIHKSGIVFHIKRNTIDNDTLGQLKVPQNVNSGDSKEYIEPLDVFLKPLLFQLCLSLPNTLCLEFVNPFGSSLYVKQYYLTNNFVPLEIQNEKSRCFLTDGKLIKFIGDDVVMIYCHNGEIFRCNVAPAASKPSSTIEQNVQVKNEKGKDAKQKKSDKVRQQVIDQTPLAYSLPADIGVTIKSYEHVLATGERFMVYDDQKCKLEPLFLRTYSDVFNGVLISERADGTKLTFNRDGTLFVNFPDGSRITTKASIDVNEVSFGTGEELDEAGDFVLDEADDISMNTNCFKKHIPSQEFSEIGEEYHLEEESYVKYNYFQRKSEAFVLINLQFSFEHINYASVSTDLNKEEININLPCNVNFTMSSEGLYKIYLDENSEFITDYDKLIFRELNGSSLPEFNIYLSDRNVVENDITTNEKVKQDNDNLHSILKNTTTNPSIVDDENINKVIVNEVKKNIDVHFIIFSCEDDNGNKLTVNNEGDIEINVSRYDYDDDNNTICKCSTINNERLFVFNEEYNGLEIFPSNGMDIIDTESKKVKGCVAQNYGTIDHNVLLLLMPLIQNEKEKWLKPLEKETMCSLYTLPSTYNDEHTTYNPFPKRKPQPEPLIIPTVLLVRVINRVNCNVHLLEKTFLQNKKTPDSLRFYKDPMLALELYKRGDIPLCKADQVFIEYIKNNIIGSLIARVRSRVIHRLEIRKIKEYTEILVKRLLLPYFDSAQGATFVILMDLILASVQMCSEEKHKLEKLFYKSLEQLRDDDLDYMHDSIAPLTVSRFCNCEENETFCKLKILLLAGKTLHGIFPDMITVFFSYGSTLKKSKENQQPKLKWRTLLFKPSDTLTEDDLVLLHNKLKTQPNVQFCTCNTNNIQQCKLFAILVACVILNFIIPDVNSVLKAYKIEINT